MRRLVLALAIPGLLLGALSALAGPPRLHFPVRCQPGQDCFIHNYFDHDQGPGVRDFACGALGFQGHTGTDIRVRNQLDMRRGVEVLAAAPGVVKSVRDGMADVSVDEVGLEAVQGREAGNGVAIDHGDGWETQYSHLRQGSVRVRPGDHVEAGDPLGLIGLSGAAEFPHVELMVRHDGKAVDPFTGEAGPFRCNDTSHSLWAGEALARLSYQPTGLLQAGFAAERPDSKKARRGAYSSGLGSDPPALVFWVELFGIRAGDRQTFRIIAPSGRVAHEQELALPVDKVVWFGFSGLGRPDSGWEPGAYRGVCLLQRDGRTILTAEAVATVRR